MGERSGKPDAPHRGLELRPVGLLVVAVVVLVGVFTGIGMLIEGPLEPTVGAGIDEPVVEYVARQRSPVVNDVMRALTHLGGTPFVALLLAAAAGGAYLLTKALRWPAFFAAVAVGGLQLSGIVKLLVGRPRPSLALYTVDSAAFPSGHAAASAACSLAIAVFASRTGRARPAAAWVVGVTMPLAIGFTRVYLGVHWPSDVVFGWALGAAWVLVALHAAGLARRREPS